MPVTKLCVLLLKALLLPCGSFMLLGCLGCDLNKHECGQEGGSCPQRALEWNAEVTDLT